MQYDALEGRDQTILLHIGGVTQNLLQKVTPAVVAFSPNNLRLQPSLSHLPYHRPSELKDVLSRAST